MNQKSFKFFGFIIVICSIVFITYRVWDTFPEIQFKAFTFNTFFYFVLVTSVYSAAVFCVALAWQKFLISQEEARASLNICQKIYSRSVIAKYVPVGILEYAGRHFQAGEYGISQSAVASANIWEILSQVFVASIFLLVSLSLSNSLPDFVPLNLIIAIIIILIIIFSNFNKVIKLMPWLIERINISPIKFRYFILPMMFYLIFFIILGGILSIITLYVAELSSLREVAYIFTISTVAWLLGYITPGAPAGLGIRETTLLLGLSGMVGEPNSILIIGIFRLVTVLGDFLYFTMGYFLSR